MSKTAKARSLRRKTSPALEAELAHYLNSDATNCDLLLKVATKLEAAQRSPDFDPDKLAEELQANREAHEKEEKEKRLIKLTKRLMLALCLICVFGVSILTIPHIIADPIFHCGNTWIGIILATIFGGASGGLLLSFIPAFIAEHRGTVSDPVEIGIPCWGGFFALIGAVVFVAFAHGYHYDGQDLFIAAGTRSETGVVVEKRLDYDGDGLLFSERLDRPECDVKIRQEITYNGVTRTFDVWYNNISAEYYSELDVGESVNIPVDLYK